MNVDQDKKYLRVNKLYVLVVILILGAGLLGWWLGRSDSKPSIQTAEQNESSGVNDEASGVTSLVSYTLPDGWREATCETQNDAIFIVPAGAPNVDCDANPSSLVKIAVDPANNKDCNQLQSVQNVSKHICISEYINGRKSLKAETVYNKESSYKNDTTINAYYIDSGEGVIKLEYVHDPSNNEYLGGFEQLAKSVRTN